MQPASSGPLTTQIRDFVLQANDLRLKGLLPEAEKGFAALFEKFPNYPFLVYHYANFKIEQKQYAQARKMAEDILKDQYFADLLSVVSLSYWEEKNYEKAIEIIKSAPEEDASCSNILRNRIVYDFSGCRFADIILHTDKLLQDNKSSPIDSLIIHAARAISYFALNEMENFKNSLQLALPLIDDKLANESSVKYILYSFRIYIIYLQYINNFMNANPQFYGDEKLEEIYIIGESHCLSPAYTALNIKGKKFRVIPKLIFGTKMFWLKNGSEHIAKISFQKTLSEIPTAAKIIICFGEIDCRVDEGIYPNYLKNGAQELDKIISDTVNPYVDFITETLNKSGHDYYICGTPAPLGKTIAGKFFKGKIKQERIPDYLNMVKGVNSLLRSRIEKEKFVDIYNLPMTAKAPPMSNSI